MARMHYQRLSVCALAIGFFCFTLHGSAQMFPALHAYESCDFPDGLTIVETSALAQGVMSRPVQTRHGTLPLKLSAGRRVMFGYPNTDFFANVKVEVLPSENYAAQKQLALDGFDYTLASGDNTRNYSLPLSISGFEVHGLDRSKLEGGVLGFYLLSEDATHVLTTIYFLNQEPERRRFATLEEYVTLRNKFLATYTSCIRKNMSSEKQVSK